MHVTPGHVRVYQKARTQGAAGVARGSDTRRIAASSFLIPLKFLKTLTQLVRRAG